MITAAKHPVGSALVWQLIRTALVKHFSAVRLRQRGAPWTEAVPTLLYVSHTSWWDGYMCLVLEHGLLHRDPYLMMEEKNLRRYRFFSWAGVFGVDRDDGRAALQSLEYAAGLLRDHPDRDLYLFPQGSVMPADQRPLHLYSGAARLAARVGGPVRLAPVALRYEFLQEQRPEVFASVGPARIITPDESQHHRALLATMTSDLTAELDLLHADITAEHLEDFRTFLRGRTGIDRAFDRLLLRQRRESRRHAIEAAARAAQGTIDV